MDKSSSELASFAQLFLDNESKSNLAQHIYETIPKQQITNAITTIKSLTRKKHDKYYEEMLEQFIRIRRFLPAVFKTINFKPTESGQNVYDAIKFLHSIEGKKKSTINNRAGYTLCVLDNLQSNMRSKDLFVEDSEKWCDPRTKLLSGDKWLTQRTPVCKLLGLPIEAIDAAFLLSNDLDIAYSTTLANFNANDNLEIIKKTMERKE